MKKKLTAVLAFAAVVAAVPALAQEPDGDHWAPVRALEGTWEGAGEGFGDADTYEMVLELGPRGGELKPCQTMELHRVD